MNTAVLTRLIESLTSKKIPYVLIGGLALHFYNFDRQTMDIDFLINKTDFNTIVPILGSLGYSLANSQDAFAQFEGIKDDLMNVDFMFVDNETLGTIIRDGKVAVIAGKSFVVPSLFHLIALKLHSIKGNPHLREIKDLPDIIRLIQINKIDVTSSSFQELLGKYGTRDTFQKIMAFFKVNK